jgi:hypothetical protein
VNIQREKFLKRTSGKFMKIVCEVEGDWGEGRRKIIGFFEDYWKLKIFWGTDVGFVMTRAEKKVWRWEIEL